MKKIKLFLGSIEPFVITMPSISNTTLASAEWRLKVWATECISIAKENATMVADDQYKVYVDTTLIGKGDVWMQLVIDVADEDYRDGYRPQMPILETIYTVVDTAFKDK